MEVSRCYCGQHHVPTTLNASSRSLRLLPPHVGQEIYESTERSKENKENFTKTKSNSSRIQPEDYEIPQVEVEEDIYFDLAKLEYIREGRTCLQSIHSNKTNEDESHAFDSSNVPQRRNVQEKRIKKKILHDESSVATNDVVKPISWKRPLLNINQQNLVLAMFYWKKMMLEKHFWAWKDRHLMRAQPAPASTTFAIATSRSTKAQRKLANPNPNPKIIRTKDNESSDEENETFLTTSKLLSLSPKPKSLIKQKHGMKRRTKGLLAKQQDHAVNEYQEGNLSFYTPNEASDESLTLSSRARNKSARIQTTKERQKKMSTIPRRTEFSSKSPGTSPQPAQKLFKEGQKTTIQRMNSNSNRKMVLKSFYRWHSNAATLRQRRLDLNKAVAKRKTRHLQRALRTLFEFRQAKTVRRMQNLLASTYVHRNMYRNHFIAWRKCFQADQLARTIRKKACWQRWCLRVWMHKLKLQATQYWQRQVKRSILRMLGTWAHQRRRRREKYQAWMNSKQMKVKAIVLEALKNLDDWLVLYRRACDPRYCDRVNVSRLRSGLTLWRKHCQRRSFDLLAKKQSGAWYKARCTKRAWLQWLGFHEHKREKIGRRVIADAQYDRGLLRAMLKKWIAFIDHLMDLETAVLPLVDRLDKRRRRFYFVTWKEFQRTMQQKCVIAESTKAFHRKRQILRGISTLKAYAKKRRSQQVSTHRAIAYDRNQALGQTWRIWHRFIALRREQYTSIDRAHHLFTTKAKRRMFLRWHHLTQQLLSIRAKVSRHQDEVRKDRTRKGVQKWWLYTTGSRRHGLLRAMVQQHLSQKAVQRWYMHSQQMFHRRIKQIQVNQCMSTFQARRGLLAWLAWRTKKVVHRNKRILAWTHANMHRILRVFHAWHSYAITKHQRRNAFTHAMRVYQHQVVHQSWRNWRGYVIQRRLQQKRYVQGAIFHRQHVLQFMFHAWQRSSAWMKKTSNHRKLLSLLLFQKRLFPLLWRAWCDYTYQAQKKRVALTFYSLRTKRQCLAQLRTFVQCRRLRSIQGKVGRSLNDQNTWLNYFHAWVKATDLSISQRHWIDMQRRQRNQRLLALMFRMWRDGCVESRRTSERLFQSKILFQTHQQRKALYTWGSFVERKQSLLEKTQRARSLHQQRSLRCAWNRFVSYMKKEMLLHKTLQAIYATKSLERKKLCWVEWRYQMQRQKRLCCQERQALTRRNEFCKRESFQAWRRWIIKHQTPKKVLRRIQFTKWTSLRNKAAIDQWQTWTKERSQLRDRAAQVDARMKQWKKQVGFQRLKRFLHQQKRKSLDVNKAMRHYVELVWKKWRFWHTERQRTRQMNEARAEQFMQQMYFRNAFTRWHHRVSLQHMRLHQEVQQKHALTLLQSFFQAWKTKGAALTRLQKAFSVALAHERKLRARRAFLRWQRYQKQQLLRREQSDGMRMFQKHAHVLRWKHFLSKNRRKARLQLVASTYHRDFVARTYFSEWKSAVEPLSGKKEGKKIAQNHAKRMLLRKTWTSWLNVMAWSMHRKKLLIVWQTRKVQRAVLDWYRFIQTRSRNQDYLAKKKAIRLERLKEQTFFIWQTLSCTWKQHRLNRQRGMAWATKRLKFKYWLVWQATWHHTQVVFYVKNQRSFRIVWKVWKSWQRFKDAKKEKHELLDLMDEYSTQTHLRGSVRQWHLETTWRRKKKELQSLAVTSYARSMLQKGWRAFIELYQHAHALEDKLAVFEAKTCLRLLGVPSLRCSMAPWCNVRLLGAKSKWHRRVVGHRKLVLSWSDWRKSVIAFQHRRSQAIELWRQAFISKFWEEWRLLQLFKHQRRYLIRLAQAHLVGKRVGKVFTAWLQHRMECQQGKERKGIAKDAWKNRTYQRVFKSWYSLAAVRIQYKNALTLFARLYSVMKKRSAFAFWSCLCRQYDQLMILYQRKAHGALENSYDLWRCFMLWRRWKHLQNQEALKHWTKKCTSHSLRVWEWHATHVWIQKRNQEWATQFYLITLRRHGWKAWKRYRTQLHHRQKRRRYFRQVCRTLLSQVLASWQNHHHHHYHYLDFATSSSDLSSFLIQESV